MALAFDVAEYPLLLLLGFAHGIQSRPQCSHLADYEAHMHAFLLCDKRHSVVWYLNASSKRLVHKECTQLHHSHSAVKEVAPRITKLPNNPATSS